jgi:hypothetical protein
LYVDTMTKTSARPLLTSPFARNTTVVEYLPDYTLGDRVTHDHYGLGRIVRIQGTDYVTVDFGSETIRFARSTRALSKI